MKKLFLAVIVLTAGAAKLNAQALASASATATIVAPISIAKTSDMNFGNMAVSAAVGGTVTMEASSAATRTVSAGGGVSFPAVTGTVTAARFTVAGAPNLTYDVAVPAGAILVNGVNIMNITAFSVSAGAGVLNGTGVQDIFVGGDLEVNAAQAPGVYVTTTDFVVAVNYN